MKFRKRPVVVEAALIYEKVEECAARPAVERTKEAEPVAGLPQPYHPSASHVHPEYRDGWNECCKQIYAAMKYAAPCADDARDAARLMWYSRAVDGINDMDIHELAQLERIKDAEDRGYRRGIEDAAKVCLERWGDTYGGKDIATAIRDLKDAPSP